MSRKLIRNIAIELGLWFPKGRRIEFAMHGEPTLHPYLIWAIKIFRQYNPKAQLQITTNGIKLTDKLIKELFKAGLNILIVDLYSKKKEILAKIKKSGVEMVDYYHTDFNPYHYHPKLPQKIVCMFDLGNANGQRKTRVITNHAGNAKHTVPISPYKKKCDKPFRELSIHYDGTIPGCCMDWRHELIIGKADYHTTTHSLQKIWESAEMGVLRYKLYDKDRSLLPCCTCDYGGGFRLGFIKPPPKPSSYHFLLFDKMRGKNKMYHHPNARKQLTFQELQKSRRKRF